MYVHFVPAEHESAARIAPSCLDRRHAGRAAKTTTSGQGVDVAGDSHNVR